MLKWNIRCWLLALLFKTPSKVKLTNTLQHIQVYKFQENQMSKSSRKLWKSIYTLSYDLMKLHTWEVAKFQYQFICTSTFSSPKLTLDTVLPSDLQRSLYSHLPSEEMDNLVLGWVDPCHAAQTCRERCRWTGRCQRCHHRLFPRALSLHLLSWTQPCSELP